ncbi:unnamed protein product [Ixodes persulcatus]
MIFLHFYTQFINIDRRCQAASFARGWHCQAPPKKQRRR